MTATQTHNAADLATKARDHLWMHFTRLSSYAENPVVLAQDSIGGKVASRPGAQGAEQVATALLALTRRPPRQIAMATVNGAPGLVLRDADGVLSVISFTVDSGRIAARDVVRNPDKLTGVREPG